MYRVSNLLWNSWCQFRLLAILLLGVSGMAHANPLNVGEIRPDGWVYLGRAAPDQTVSFNVFLHRSNQKEFDEFAKAVTNPRSDKYGQYRSMEEIIEMQKPKESAYIEIEGWLKSAGFSEALCLKHWDNYACKDVPVALTERLLGVRINVYRYDVLDSRLVFKTEDEMVFPSSVEHIIGLKLKSPNVKSRSKKRV